jgi:hypothetical protein
MKIIIIILHWKTGLIEIFGVKSQTEKMLILDALS